MSSIYGFFSKNESIEVEGLKLWNSIYGSFDRSDFHERNIYLGGSLSADSVHPSEKKAVLSAGCYHAVLDAVVYNRDELLKKTGLDESLSDEMLLLSSFITFGSAILAEINGDFAGVIYNSKSRTMYIFRDHTGVRPLFFYFNSDLLVFSSDIRGLLSCKDISVEIKEDWAYGFLSGNIAFNASDTEYRNIFRVSPATIITIKEKNGQFLLTNKKYWKPASRKIRFQSFKKNREQLRKLIEDSVKRRLDAYPGKIGAELSGGLDSGVVDILINRFQREGVYFSWSDSPDILPITHPRDERNIIQKICDQEKITCIYNNLSPNDMIADVRSISESLGLCNESYFFPVLTYAFPTYINAITLGATSRVAKENGASVVFSGHGGDEGVSHRCNAYELFHYHEFYHYLRYQFGKTHGQKHRIIKTLKICKENFKYARETLFKPFVSDLSAKEFISQSLNKKKNTFKSPLLYFNFDPVKYYSQGATLVRLENAALIGAYSAIRYVFPYLDYRVFDFALSIQRNNFLKNGINRYIFREAFKDIMPTDLYKVSIKEDISKQSIKSTEDWFPAFAQKKAALADVIDNELWANILDFEAIDNWIKSGKPSEQDRARNEILLLVFCNLLMAQTCLTGSRHAAECAKEKEQVSQPTENK